MEGDMFFDFEGELLTDDKYLVGYITCNNSIRRIIFDNDLNAIIKINGFDYTGDFNDKKIFKVNKFPNRSNVRKRYKPNDKVYYVYHGYYLKYGEVIAKVNDGYYKINDDFVLKNTIIPSDWWILHERCVSAIYETSKCLLKLRIYKDLRVLIAKYIWESRNDEEWGYLSGNRK